MLELWTVFWRLHHARPVSFNGPTGIPYQEKRAALDECDVSDSDTRDEYMLYLTAMDLKVLAYYQSLKKTPSEPTLADYADF